jgi:hypothetical protein
MATMGGPFEIHSAARGPHWIAWVSRPGAEQPHGSVVLVGETQEEAEARARGWIQSLYGPAGSDLSARS